jgi:hypothetical protein
MVGRHAHCSHVSPLQPVQTMVGMRAHHHAHGSHLTPLLPVQIMVAAMMCPPQPGDPSHREFRQQRSAILDSLARRAKKVAEALRKLEGVTCASHPAWRGSRAKGDSRHACVWMAITNR